METLLCCLGVVPGRPMSPVNMEPTGESPCPRPGACLKGPGSGTTLIAASTAALQVSRGFEGQVCSDWSLEARPRGRGCTLSCSSSTGERGKEGNRALVTPSGLKDPQCLKLPLPLSLLVLS